MEPNEVSVHETEPQSPPLSQESAPLPVIKLSAADTQPAETRFLLAILMGPNGLRAGWSIAAFLLLIGLIGGCVGWIFVHLHLVNQKAQQFTASAALFGEAIPFLGLVGAAAIVALLERRRENLLAYNLLGPRRLSFFAQGLVAGFVSLSLLMGALTWGGWLHFGPVSLTGFDIVKFAFLWGIAFLLVGGFEEGLFRCYLQSTLTRGLNFWWAIGIVGLIVGELFWRGKGNGIWGVYIFAAAGLIPCLLLQLNKAENAGFWNAAWVSSTLFGFIHTGNNGENWIGIFAAAAIGFAFVVSIRVTGSAWWAIGCHASWDWGETFFYGAADSGNVATGHYLSVTPVGSAFWSGGTDGPEGSILVLGIIALMIVFLVAAYGRRKPVIAPAVQPAELAAQ